jgi:hypothetical protein
VNAGVHFYLMNNAILRLEGVTLKGRVAPDTPAGGVRVTNGARLSTDTVIFNACGLNAVAIPSGNPGAKFDAT